MSTTEPETPAQGPAQVRPFAAVLQEVRGGAAHVELSDSFAALVAACVEHGKPGSMALTVKVKPNKDGVTVFISDHITVKKPLGERAETIFFTDDVGNVSRRDPRQIELPLRDASRPPADTRSAQA